MNADGDETSRAYRGLQQLAQLVDELRDPAPPTRMMPGRSS